MKEIKGSDLKFILITTIGAIFTFFPVTYYCLINSLGIYSILIGGGIAFVIVRVFPINQFHYYIINDNSILVRNRLKKDFNREYSFNEIDSVKIQISKYYQYNRIIINGDMYISVNLSEKHFKYMSEILEQNNIQVAWEEKIQ